MKVCIIGDNKNTKAGWGRMISAIGSELQKHGIDVGYILNRSEFNKPAAKTLLIPFYNILFWPFSILRMRRFIKNYDFIHVIDLYPYGVLAALSNLFLGKKLIIHCLGTYSLLPKGNFLIKKLTKWCLKKADHIFVVSDFTLSQMRKSGLNPVNPEILSVGVDIEKFSRHPKTESLVKDPFILCTGAVKPRKGIKELIEGFSCMPKSADVKLVIVGNKTMPNYEKEIDELVAKHELADKIIFLENISDDELLALYNECLFFSLLPLTLGDAMEGFGLVFFEAAICGKTSIGSLGSGAQDAIMHEKTGLLVDPYDKNAVGNAILRLFENSDYRAVLEKNAKEHALKHDWGTIVNRIVEVYQGLRK